MPAAVVMMAKLPIPGYCKSRLLDVMTRDETAEFQRRCVVDLAQTVQLSGFPLYVYYAAPGSEETGNASIQCRDLAKALPVNTSFVPQSGADLGVRMYNAVHDVLCHHEEAIVIGSDMPDLDPAVFQIVTHYLKKYDLVLGPSEDGGYYLLAVKGDYPIIFEQIQWSSSQVLEHTLDKARQAGLKYFLLDTRRDIDTWDDMIDFFQRGRGSQTCTYAYAARLVERYPRAEKVT